MSPSTHRARVLDARTRALHLLDELEQLDPDRRPLLAQARHLVITASDQTLARLEGNTR